jgi:hypothetical protein
VSAYDWFGSVAFVPLGYILVGPLSSALGIRLTLILAAAWAAASCAAVLASRGVRELTAPPAALAPPPADLTVPPAGIGAPAPEPAPPSSESPGHRDHDRPLS